MTDKSASSTLVDSGVGSRRDDGATNGRALAAGGVVLALATMVAAASNYVLNVMLARWFTPAQFADANLIVTLMLLVTAIAVGLQLVGARHVGINEVRGDHDQTAPLARWLRTRAAIMGLMLGAGLVVGAPLWRSFFNSESAIPFAILGLGLPFYLSQAVGRGVLQGQLRFVALAATFLVEAVVRLSLGLGLVVAGFGVEGATVGLTASFIATWAHVAFLTRERSSEPLAAETPSTIITYTGPVAILLLGQIVINNGDVLVAKRFLEPTEAGIYAVIALVGRAVFFLSWSVATTLFPASARNDESGEDSTRLLRFGSATIAGLGLIATIGAAVLGGPVLDMVFGPVYGALAPQLAAYAAATSLFAVGNLIATHQLSTGRSRQAKILLVGGLVQTAALVAARGGIESLITAQVVVMALLLVALAPALWPSTSSTESSSLPPQTPDPREGRDPQVSDTPLTESSDSPDSPTERTELVAGSSPVINAYRDWASEPIEGDPYYSVIIPTYNEEERILPTIGAVALHFCSLGKPWELIVADDGSTDSTVSLVQDLGLVNLRVLIAEANGGKGSAVRRGMLAGRGEILLFSDADYSTPVEQFDDLEAMLAKGFDVAIGSRAAEGALVEDRTWMRRLFSWGLRQVLHVTLRLPIEDTQCGFKAFNRRAVDEIFPRQLIDGFSFDLEILYLARRRGLRLVEVPVRWFDAPGSKVDAVSVGIRFLGDMARIRVNAIKGAYDQPTHTHQPTGSTDTSRPAGSTRPSGTTPAGPVSAPAPMASVASPPGRKS